MTRETVPTPTPASSATSLMLGTTTTSSNKAISFTYNIIALETFHRFHTPIISPSWKRFNAFFVKKF